MAAETIASLPKLFKDIFGSTTPEMLALRGKPAVSRMRKVDDMEGSSKYFPIRTHLHTGASHTFSNAQSMDTTNDIYRWNVTTKDHYAIIRFNAKALKASRSSLGSYVRLKAKELQEQLEYVGQRMEREIWLGTQLGQILAAPTNVSGSTYTFQMKDSADIVNIHVGMKIGAWSSSADSATQRNLDGTATYATVTKINHGANLVTATFSGNPLTNDGGDSPWGANDYLYVDGDRTSSAVLGWTGISQWIPTSDPSSGESFKGVDRSVMTNYLSGWRLASTYGTVEETCQQLAVLMAPYVSVLPSGGSEFWMAYDDVQRLNSEAGARLIREPGGTAELGYTGFKIGTPLGPIRVMSGPFVPSGGVRLLDWSTWAIHTLGDLFHLVDEDGQEMLRSATADEFEMRYRSWSEVVCEKPIHNGYAAL